MKIVCGTCGQTVSPGAMVDPDANKGTIEIPDGMEYKKKAIQWSTLDHLLLDNSDTASTRIGILSEVEVSTLTALRDGLAAELNIDEKETVT